MSPHLPATLEDVDPSSAKSASDESSDAGLRIREDRSPAVTPAGIDDDPDFDDEDCCGFDPDYWSE